MKKLKISNGFSQMADLLLLSKASHIHSSLTGNPNFASPIPTLAAFAALIKAFGDALKDCKDGDRLKVAIKKQKREELIAALHKLADFVLFKSNGDRVVALTSGFSIAKVPAPSPPLSKPEGFVIKPGPNKGQLIAKVNHVKRGIGHSFDYATDAMLAQGVWHSILSSKTTCIISNLQSGVNYHCRVVVLGVKDQVVYSETVSRIVA